MDGDRKIFIGLGVLMIGIWALSHYPSWPARWVIASLDRSVRLLDSGFLLVSAIILVGINAARAFFLYAGWFMMGGKYTPLLGIPACYAGAWFLRLPSVPHFGVPAVMALISVGIIQYLSRGVARQGNRVVVLGVLIFSLQWLDVIPSLTAYGFGWGELSMSIKEVATLMDRDRVLNLVGMMLFFFSFAVAMVVIELFVGYEKRLSQLRVLRDRERELARLRQDQTQSRVFREIQYLVHDLKRPLTTITGLADVLVHSSVDPSVISHGNTIQRAAGRMNQMVSEIGDPMAVQTISPVKAVEYCMSQISPLDWARKVTLNVPEVADSSRIKVNLIRLSRALVNLLENAHRATEGIERPSIALGLLISDDQVVFKVWDNGPGFSGRPVSRRSQWGSTGLGLAFVREVVEAYGGSLSLDNGIEGGASVSIYIPKVETERSASR
nr:HAMP domain-containing sensor histidine kinase [uncultured Dethiosulfovibrio sp.]